MRRKSNCASCWLELTGHCSITFKCIRSRGAPDRIEVGYRPDRALSSIVSDEGLFSELGNEDYETRSRLLPQSGEKLFYLRHNLINFDSQSQI